MVIILDKAIPPYRKHREKENHMSNLVTVPNGTEIVSPIYADLVQRYRTFAKQSAENIIKLSETLVEAKHKLSDADLQKFCGEVGLQHDGSTYRKLLKIGTEVSRFEPFLARMPNNWTTVYKLAKLEKDKFDLVANDNRFTPMMTASEVDSIVGGSATPKNEHSRDLMIDLSGFDRLKMIAVCKKIKALKQDFGFNFTVASHVQKEIQPPAKLSFLDYLDQVA
jgi:hypothetical protein